MSYSSTKSGLSAYPDSPASPQDNGWFYTVELSDAERIIRVRQSIELLEADALRYERQGQETCARITREIIAQRHARLAQLTNLQEAA